MLVDTLTGRFCYKEDNVSLSHGMCIVHFDREGDGHVAFRIGNLCCRAKSSRAPDLLGYNNEVRARKAC